jgi:hypothetical protein
MKRKFKKRWSTIPPISTKRTTTSLNIQKKTQHDFGNPGVGLEQAQSCGRVKLINGIPILCS